jgi:Na+-translocating ferredoxin:NAD+ oxidoreductase RnfC subunit
MNRLVHRLGLARYDVKAPLTEVTSSFKQVKLKLRQHIGAAAQPVVQAGVRVSAGEVVGELPQGALSARVHASIRGIVRDVSNDVITIEAD